MINEDKDFFIIDFTGIFKAVLKRIWIIILSTALCAGAGAAYASSIQTTPMFRSSAGLYITGSYSATLTPSTITAGQAVLSSYYKIIESRPVLTTVIETLELNMTYSQLKSLISESSVAGTCMVTLSVSFADPEWAKAILDEIIKVSSKYAYEIMGMAPPVVYDEPTVPKTPYNITSNLKRFTAYGGAAGFAVSLMVIVIIVLLDNKVRNTKNVKWKSGLDVWAILPKTAKEKQEECTRKAMKAFYSELWAMEENPKVVTFVSEKDGEKRTAVNAFAKFLKDIEKKVIVVDADLNNMGSSYEKLFEEESEGVYLEDYLNGKTDNLDDVIRIQEDIAYLYPHNPILNSYEFLKGQKFSELFTRLKEDYDYIVVDTAAWDKTNDAKAMADYSDVMFAVFTCGKTVNKVSGRLVSDIGKDSFTGAVFSKVKVKKSKAFVNEYGKFIGVTKNRSK